MLDLIVHTHTMPGAFSALYSEYYSYNLPCATNLICLDKGMTPAYAILQNYGHDVMIN